MKVLHFIPGSGVGGIERFVMDITAAPSDGMEYEFIVFARGESQFVDCIRQRGTVYICSGWSKATLQRVYHLMKQNKYDVVHTHAGCWSFLILMLATLCGIKKKIAHSHSADGFADRNAIGKLIYLLSKVVNPLCVTHYFACSDHACKRTFGKRILTSSKYTRILNPVDFSRIHAYDSMDEHQLRKELHLRENSRIVCNVGYLGKHKNQMFLLQLAKRPEMAEIDFLLIGDGYRRKQLEDFIRQEKIKNVYLAGVRNDVPAILHLSDLFVLPSVLEGLGTVVLEAQACGTPCLISENVTTETDLGLELVTQIPLARQNRWIEAICSTHKSAFSDEYIEMIFKKKKVEMVACIQLIESIYKE